jgi:hypothetical protein
LLLILSAAHAFAQPDPPEWPSNPYEPQLLDSSIFVGWQPVQGAVGYYVYRGIDDENIWDVYPYGEKSELIDPETEPLGFYDPAILDQVSWWVFYTVTTWDGQTESGPAYPPVGVGFNLEKLQWYDDGTWTDVSGTMYVTQGTQVTFRAVRDNPYVQWPAGKPAWSGSSGASGTGVTKTVTFNALSSDLTDYKTVTAECGNSKTANVVVYNLTGSLTPEDDFQGRSVTDYGVEELIDLSSGTNPSGIPVNWKWIIASGVGSLDPEGAANTQYDAMHVPGSLTLKLEVISGPSKGLGPSFPRSIVAPSGTRMYKLNSNVWHRYLKASAGFELLCYLDPTNVSFTRIKFREDACSPTNVSDFFSECEPISDGPSYTNSYPGGNPVRNHPQGDWIGIGFPSSSDGCVVMVPDKTGWATAGPFGPGGGYTWEIPTHYQDNQSNFHTFGSGHVQSVTLSQYGDTTVTKRALSVSKELLDADSDY